MLQTKFRVMYGGLSSCVRMYVCILLGVGGKIAKTGKKKFQGFKLSCLDCLGGLLSEDSGRNAKRHQKYFAIYIFYLYLIPLLINFFSDYVVNNLSKS